ncbi:Hypp7602 [Branchiostoma lanceolatum]|uniref:Synaptopodin 2-like protein n=2 Tax=Branchiostoma lanceolatum TaxID=7740 RepID=A0A8J9Z1Z0_BRALA|nr:Hypp7602 [Branchiostoma lanceolatum]
MGKGERLTAVLTGGPPWGFRLSGGLEVKQPLKVAKVRKKSKAHGSGLQEGDEVLAVNGAPCQDVTHKDCMGIVEGATDRLELEVLRKRPTYNAQPAGQTTEQEESGSKLEIKVNSVAKKDNKQHVSTLQIKPVTVSASSVKSESRREVSAITVAKEESSSQHSQVVRSTESEYSTLERKSKNVSKVNGLGQVSVFSGSVRSEEEKSEERKTQGFSYLQPGDIRSLGQSGSPEEKQKRAPPPTAARPSQEEFPVNPPPSYSRALADPQYQQVYSPTSGQPGDQPFEEEEPPSSAFRSVRPPGPIKLESQQGHGINSHPGPLPRQQQQIQEPQAVTSTQPAVQRPTPIRQQPATVYQPERQAGSPHTWSAGVPKQGPVPAPQPAAQQPAGSYPFDPPAPYSQPPASAPTHTWNPAGRAKPKTPITPTTPTEASPNKVFSVFDVGATWEPPKEEDERAAENMMNAKPKAPMFKVKKFDFKPQTWSEGSSSGRPMTQEDFQTMDLPLGPMGQYRDKQREMLAYEKSGAVWSPSGTTPVSGPKAWSPGGGEVQGRPHEVREVREQPWSPTGRPQAPQPQSPQPAPAVWSPGGGGGQAPRAAQPVSFLPGGGGGDHGPQPTSNGVWRPSQMPPSSQGYYSGERDSGIWSPTGTTQATAPSRSFNDTDGHASPASFDPRPKMVSAQSSSARSAAASLKKPGAPGRGGKAVGPTRVGPLPSYLNIQEEQTRNASEHFMTVKPTPALTSQEPSKPTLQALPTRSYIEIQKEPKPEPENAADKEKKQKQRLHPKSISEYYNLPPEAALPEKDTTKRIPVSEIEPINFNVDLEDRSRCTHQTPEMLSHDAARRLAEATFFEEGKGANMFMKRMERMSKYVIDESNVKKAPPKPQVSPNAQQYQYQQQQQQKSTPTVQEMKDMMSQVTYKRPPKSPWEAAMEGSGKIEGAFSHIRGNKLLLDVPAGSQQEYDPFDPTLPFPGAQPTDLGGEGGPGWAAQDGMIEKPTSPTGPQFKDFNPKPRGWVSSGGGYLSDQLAADYESDTNMSTSSAPARQLFKVSKVTGKEPSVWLPGQ